MIDTNKIFTHYEAGRAAGRLTTYDTEAKVVAGTIILAIQRDRCYVCDPERTDLFEAEVEEQYGLGCDDINHAAYSAGFTAGAMETVFQEAVRLEVCGPTDDDVHPPLIDSKGNLISEHSTPGAPNPAAREPE